jgi:hypothetical protein
MNIHCIYLAGVATPNDYRFVVDKKLCRTTSCTVTDSVKINHWAPIIYTSFSQKLCDKSECLGSGHDFSLFLLSDRNTPQNV